MEKRRQNNGVTWRMQPTVWMDLGTRAAVGTSVDASVDTGDPHPAWHLGRTLSPWTSHEERRDPELIETSPKHLDTWRL